MILAVHENVSMELYVKKSTRLILNVYVVRVIMDRFAKTVIQGVKLEIIKSQLFNYLHLFIKTSMNAKISMLVQRIAFVEIALALMNVSLSIN